jgi:hypothetical protein
LTWTLDGSEQSCERTAAFFGIKQVGMQKNRKQSFYFSFFRSFVNGSADPSGGAV